MAATRQRKDWTPALRSGALRDVGRALRRCAERGGIDSWSRVARDDLDRRLEPYLAPSSPGFFVEAGAHDGVWRSNTYFLERCRGWTGLLVEPVPALAASCARARSRSTVISCALVAPESAGRDVTLCYADVMSFVEGTHGSPQADEAYLADARQWLGVRTERLVVPGRTLHDVLVEADAPERIAFLSLDVEGAEAQVLRGLDLSRHRPRVILVELQSAKAVAETSGALGDRYEMVARLTHHDYLFVDATDGGGP